MEVRFFLKGDKFFLLTIVGWFKKFIIVYNVVRKIGGVKNLDGYINIELSNGF